MRTLVLLSSLSFTLACNGDQSDSGDATGDDSFAPMEGTWSWANGSYESDECGIETLTPVSVLEAFVWTLSWTDDGFDLTTTVGDPISCQLSGMDMTCSSPMEVELDEWPEGSGIEGDPDVVFVGTNDVAGVFVDEQTSSGSATISGVCEGTDCEAYLEALGASTPCTSVFVGDFNMNN